jgi:hypothetical protein
LSGKRERAKSASQFGVSGDEAKRNSPGYNIALGVTDSVLRVRSED